MKAKRTSREVLAVTACLAGVSIAWFASAATLAGPAPAADFSRCAGYWTALKNAHLAWDEPTLAKFLQDPSGLAQKANAALYQYEIADGSAPDLKAH
jgi:hypothetical protein